MPTIHYVQGQPFLIPDEVTELPTGTQPALPVTQDWYPAGYDNQQALPANQEPDFWSRIAKVGNKLLGTGGEERYQLWPERMVRSGLTLPAEVMQGKVLSGAGLRREDFTDIPPSQESQTWIGKKLGLPAVPEQPLDPLIERAQDVAGMQMGTTMFAKPGTASVGNIAAAESGKVGAPLSALEKAPMFYSNVENAVKASKQNAASKEQWLSYLKNQPGVKPEELEWTVGNLPEGKITKQQLEQHIAENKVQFNEVWKKQSSPYNYQGNEWQIAIDRAEAAGNWAEAERIGRAWEGINEETGSTSGQPKYQSYQLPGGENYRELLLTLPDTSLKTKNNIAKEIGYTNDYKDLSFRDQNIVDNFYIERIKDNKIPEFRSSHWEEPNVLAHIRMNDRNIPDVGKSLHIEEIQSDWHQAGRKQGYIEKDIMDRSVIKNKMKEIENKAPSGLDGMENAQWLENQHDYVRLRDEYNRSLPNNENRVPNAPFKKTWDELALKRTINEAVRNGYDAISWTPGEAQAARYDLSKHIDELHYQNKTNTLTALDHNGRTIIDEVVPKEKVSDYIGKEAAEKLFKTKPDKTGQHLLEGADLKVGGEGMKAFYDKMMVDKANALAKKYGVKVETKDLNTNHDASLNEPFENRSKAENVLNKGGKIYAVSRSGEHLVTSVKELKELEADGYGPFYQYILGDIQPKEPVHVLKLTPELKKAVSEKGFPLFTGGIPHVPPPEEPTFDERWRDRVPDEMMKRDEIKDLLEQQKIRNLPLDYTPPERKFEGRPVHLTKVNFTPEF